MSSQASDDTAGAALRGLSGESAGAGGVTDTTLKRRDAADVVRALEAWLPTRVGAARVAVRNLRAPSGAGFSNETYLFDASWRADDASEREAGGRQEAQFVVQAAPIGDALFQRYDLATMFDLQHALAGHGVPVAKVRWYEGDAAALGAPFYVMDYVPGRVPSDSPSYMAEGFVFDATPDERASMWWSSLEAMAALHRIDPATLEPGLRARLGAGVDPIAERLAFWLQFVCWASPDALPLHADAAAWLRAHRPQPKAPLSVTWGDPKLANIIFDDARAQALLDWELCGVGYAEEDLAHFLWMAHYACVNCGADRLAGIGGHDETVERYAALLGRELEDLEWWWTFSVFRLSAICHRIMHQVRALGGMPAEVDVGQINPITSFLRDELARATAAR